METNKNKSLSKALKIIETMSEMECPVKLIDLSRKLQMAPSTVLRFLNSLIEDSYVAQEPSTSSYYLTLKIASIGKRCENKYPFQKILQKYVDLIVENFNESASLCIENNMKVLYIATKEGPSHLLQTLSRIGRIAPMHATGTGKLLLLNYSDSELENFVQKQGLTEFTDYTLTSLESLKQELQTIKAQGYALDNEECEVGVRCLAVPVKDFTGRIVAALSVSAPITRLDMNRIQNALPTMKQIGLEASKEMGWNPQSCC